MLVVGSVFEHRALPPKTIGCWIPQLMCLKRIVLICKFSNLANPFNAAASWIASSSQFTITCPSLWTFNNKQSLLQCPRLAATMKNTELQLSLIYDSCCLVRRFLPLIWTPCSHRKFSTFALCFPLSMGLSLSRTFLCMSVLFLERAKRSSE